MKDINMKAVSEFGISEIKSIIRIGEKNMWSIDDKYILKTHGDLKGLQRIVFLNAELYKAGAQVPKYHKTNSGELYVKAGDEEYYTLANKISGAKVDLYAGNYKKKAFSIGESIAKFHLSLKELTGKIEIWDNDFMNEYHDWMSREIKDKNIRIKKEVLDYLESFDELYRKLPRQIIHRDLHNSNMLIDNDEVTAFIDINEITQINVRIFDLCYFMSNLPDNDEEIVKWFEILKSLLSGYNTVSEFTDEELIAIPYMSVFIELLWITFGAMMNGSSDYSPDNGFWSYDNRSKLLFSKQDLSTKA